MTKEDFIRKFSSRKFWMCVVSFITALLIVFKVPESEITQVTSVVMAFGSLIAYTLSEGWVDAARENSKVEILEVDDDQ